MGCSFFDTLQLEVPEIGGLFEEATNRFLFKVIKNSYKV